MRRVPVIALACAVALVCALVLAACGDSRASPQAAGRRPARTAAAVPGEAPPRHGRPFTAARPAVTIAAGQPYVAIASFRSPHDQIACAIDATAVRCAISHPQWAGRSPCPTAATQVVMLGRHGPGQFDCAGGGAPRGGAAVKALPYDTVAATDGFACESYPGGVQCGTDDNAHGFFISPPLLRLF